MGTKIIIFNYFKYYLFHFKIILINFATICNFLNGI
jgi:hypothetical protein